MQSRRRTSIADPKQNRLEYDLTVDSRAANSKEPNREISGQNNSLLLWKFIQTTYGHGCGIGGVAGVPGMTIGGVPAEFPTGGVPGITVSGVPGDPGV